MENYQKFYLSALLLVFNTSVLYSQYTIQGKLIDPQQKYAKVVLEYIPSINDLNSTNAKNIINSTPIDTSGKFLMTGNDLPSDKSLYRLSLLKPDQSLGITTGFRKNYIHLSLTNNSHINLSGCAEVTLNFGNCHIEGSPENNLIQDFYDQILQSYYNDLSDLQKNNSELKKQFIYRKHSDVLKNYCDTSNYLMPSLIAFFYLKNKEEETKLDPDFFNRYKEKILEINPHSSYAIAIAKEIDLSAAKLLGQKKDFRNYWIGILSCLLLLAILYIFQLRKKLAPYLKLAQQQNPVKLQLSKLSKKELEVYQYMLAGKSNKEIASILFIEVTTVKSHIGKIYQKLGVKSRQELINHPAK